MGPPNAGNLTRDPELRSVNGGRSVVSFSLAENRRGADKDSGANHRPSPTST